MSFLLVPLGHLLTHSLDLSEFWLRGDLCDPSHRDALEEYCTLDGNTDRKHRVRHDTPIYSLLHMQEPFSNQMCAAPNAKNKTFFLPFYSQKHTPIIKHLCFVLTLSPLLSLTQTDMLL